MAGTGSSDPDGDALSYAWAFGDGANADGSTVSHVYANAGTFTVRLIVTDIRGLSDTAFTTAVLPRRNRESPRRRVSCGYSWAAGALSAGDGKWHDNKLANAVTLLDQATMTAAGESVEEVLRKLEGAGLSSTEYAESVRHVHSVAHILNGGRMLIGLLLPVVILAQGQQPPPPPAPPARATRRRDQLCDCRSPPQLAPDRELVV
jgi:hypothetical protein